MSGQRPRGTRRSVGGRGKPARPRQPKPIAGLIESYARDLEPLTALSGIQRAWPAAVGEQIAAECRPVAERGGVVTVRCSSAVWAQELSLMAPDLVARLNHGLGAPTVTELRCRSGA